MDGVTQVDEDLDVQRGVAQPGLRERARGPVGRRVPLLQGQPQDLLDELPETDAGVPGQPGAERSGVEDPLRAHPDVAQAGQVLAGRVQHPLGVREGGVQGREVGAADRVDQRGTRSGAPELDEVGTLPVPIARGALRVDGYRAAAGGEGRNGLRERCGVLDDGRKSVPGLEQRGRFGACGDVVVNVARRGLGHRARA